MRWVVCAFLIAGCDQDERTTPPPVPESAAVAYTHAADSFIELEAQTISDMSVARDWRRIKITGDGTLTDEREQQAKRVRQLSSRQFAELVHELEKVGFLSLRPCGSFDHGRHTTLTLSVLEGRNRIHDATMCHGLRGPIDHILEVAD